MLLVGEMSTLASFVTMKYILVRNRLMGYCATNMDVASFPCLCSISLSYPPRAMSNNFHPECNMWIVVLITLHQHIIRLEHHASLNNTQFPSPRDISHPTIRRKKQYRPNHYLLLLYLVEYSILIGQCGYSRGLLILENRPLLRRTLWLRVYSSHINTQKKVRSI